MFAMTAAASMRLTNTTTLTVACMEGRKEKNSKPM